MTVRVSGSPRLLNTECLPGRRPPIGSHQSGDTEYTSLYGPGVSVDKPLVGCKPDDTATSPGRGSGVIPLEDFPLGSKSRGASESALQDDVFGRRLDGLRQRVKREGTLNSGFRGGLYAESTVSVWK